MSETSHGLSMPLRRSAGATRLRTLATMLLLLGTSGSALGAQSASPPPVPTLRVALSGDAPRDGQSPAAVEPSYVVTATCPAAAEETTCSVWIETGTSTEAPPVDVQWRLARATAGCGALTLDEFRDVVAEPAEPVVNLSKGASCTLVFGFRSKSATHTTDLASGSAGGRIVQNVSLYITQQ